MIGGGMNQGRWSFISFFVYLHLSRYTTKNFFQGNSTKFTHFGGSTKNFKKIGWMDESV